MGLYNKNGIKLREAFSTDAESLTVAFKVDGTLIPFATFLQTAILSELTSISYSGNKQGACSDGEYIYQICISPFVGIKYKISDGTYTTVSLGSSVPYNHANDMAYNPNNNHIYVAAMSADGAVMELDTNWNYIATHYLIGKNDSSYSVWGLCFDQKTNHFLSENAGGIAVYDVNFNYLSWFSLPEHPSATGQGCETDGDFIYRVTYNPNYIDVATITGEYVCTINNPMSGEPETLMYDWENKKYYINRNASSGLFYEIILKTT